jgi:uncharacterized membrane protein YccC
VEDFKWLSNLGSDKLLALAIGMILVGLLVPRWVLRRQERAFDQMIEAYRVMATAMALQTDIIRQVCRVLEKQPLEGVVSIAPPHRGNGSSPSSGLDENVRHLRHGQPPHSPMHTPNGEEWTHFSSASDEH